MMGRSKSVQNAMDKDAKVNAYFKQLDEEMEKNSQNYVQEFEDSIKNFYGSKQYSQIESERHFDYSLMTEFSLDGIAEKIKIITAGLFGTPHKKENGEELPEEQSQIVSIVAPYQKAAISLAVTAISEILTSFNTTTSTELTHTLKHESIAPGFTLHLSISNKAFYAKDFFGVDQIVQNYIYYQLNFSKEKLQEEADISYLQNEIKILTDKEKLYNDFSEKYDKLSEQAMAETEPEKQESLDAQVNRLENYIKRYKAAIEEALSAIHNLEINMSKAVADGIDAADNQAPNAAILSYLRA